VAVDRQHEVGQEIRRVRRAEASVRFMILPFLRGQSLPLLGL
jgi:hypothetical protein